MSDRNQRDAIRKWPTHDEHGEPGFVTCRRSILEGLLDELALAEVDAEKFRKIRVMRTGETIAPGSVYMISGELMQLWTREADVRARATEAWAMTNAGRLVEGAISMRRELIEATIAQHNRWLTGNYRLCRVLIEATEEDRPAGAASPEP
jgi:hypothetical protein